MAKVKANLPVVAQALLPVSVPRASRPCRSGIARTYPDGFDRDGRGTKGESGLPPEKAAATDVAQGSLSSLAALPPFPCSHFASQTRP